MPDGQQASRDLVLPPDTYALVLDRTKGMVSTHVGPAAPTLTPTDQLVRWTGSGFVSADVDLAIRPFVKAGQGQYIVLSDPATGDDPERFPTSSRNEAIKLAAGQKVVIPGPASFALWPGQSAEVIDGHRLATNEYVVVRVVDAQSAAENAGRAQVEAVGEGDAVVAESYVTGQLIVIRGTNVSFYIPSTGLEVVPEGSKFVRRAVTLEQLEYCILLDESGSKRYEYGPAVVFPAPTESFLEEEGSQTFKAIELNLQSGLYVKVIEEYEDEYGNHPQGEELFLTGADTPIYFPRPEHSVIQYGDHRKHHAIAIPEGEGRYVLDRNNGQVRLVQGHAMFLPDPRNEVIVRRILPPSLVKALYPGNSEALRVNEAYEAERAALRRDNSGGLPEDTEANYLASSNMAYAGGTVSDMAGLVRGTAFAGERIRRGTDFTPPRTITLDAKYEGAVGISIWPGYAMLIMDKRGHRRVVEGPANVLLQYDETPMVLSLSTGTPKNPDALLHTPYLRTVNNSVSDEVTLETADLVPVKLRLGFRVNFEADGEEDLLRWFDVENYIALLVDHCRSRLRNMAQRHGIVTFFAETVDLVRDALLGAPGGDGHRPGLFFRENGMMLTDAEVLGSSIQHESTDAMLRKATSAALQGAITLRSEEENAARFAALQELERGKLIEAELTALARHEIATAEAERVLASDLAEQTAALQTAEAERLVQEAELQTSAIAQAQALEFRRRTDEVELTRVDREVHAYAERMAAATPDLIAALQAFGDQNITRDLVEALGPAALASGVSVTDLLNNLLKGTPLESVTEALARRPVADRLGRGD